MQKIVHTHSLLASLKAKSNLTVRFSSSLHCFLAHIHTLTFACVLHSRLEDVGHVGVLSGLAAVPIVALEKPAHLTGILVQFLLEPARSPLDAFGLALLADLALLLLQSQLFRGCFFLNITVN